MAVVPAIEHYKNHYAIAVHSTASRAYILLSVPTAKTGNLYLDGKVFYPDIFLIFAHIKHGMTTLISSILCQFHNDYTYY